MQPIIRDGELLAMPYVSIKPSTISLFYLREKSLGRSLLQIDNQKNLEHNSTEGEVSRKAERRIKQGIDWLLYLSDNKRYYSEQRKRWYNFRINFITLTLPSKQVHSDNTIKGKCLNQFLVELRRDYRVKNYLWRAEPQKNGNIHFHIVSDKFIHHSTLRKMWNRIIAKLGYVARYRKSQEFFYKNGFQVRQDLVKYWPEKKQKEAYELGISNKWSNPNSTDVHAVSKIKNISAYLAKYCTKNGEGRKIKGRLWGLSQQLSKIKSAQAELVGEVADEIEEIFHKNSDRVREGDYFKCLYLSVKEWGKSGAKILKSLFYNYLKFVKSGALLTDDPPYIKPIPIPIYYPSSVVSISSQLPKFIQYKLNLY